MPSRKIQSGSGEEQFQNLIREFAAFKRSVESGAALRGEISFGPRIRFGPLILEVQGDGSSTDPYAIFVFDADSGTEVGTIAIT